jgi:exopolyphosphatase/guanosine-5'-triphosphate,3'-diphosphate pyrophosphatase
MRWDGDVMTPARVAALDCGTNSLRLLIAEVVGDRLVDLTREMRIVRLGEGVDRTGSLAPAALARTFDAMREFAAIVVTLGADRVRLVATSATRDASNRETFVWGCREILGVEPEVVTGAEEAALSFAGATRDRPGDPPYLVVDIGGGSTEFIRGGSTPDAAASVDIGCVRLTERRLRSDPPTSAERAAAVADIDAALDVVAEAVDLSSPATLVGLAGSVTTVTALALGLPEYDPARIHLQHVSAEDVARISDDLLAMTVAERRAVPVMHPGRADVIAAGALVLRRVVERTGAADVLASERDILDGIAYSLLD